MSNLKLPLLAMAVGLACLLAGCQTSPKSERSTASTEPEAKSSEEKEAEVVGTPAKDSKFTKLQIGMSIEQVTDLIGPPTDQGAYMTGKAFIPFYFGRDRYRHELLYKGQGRLVFGGGRFGYGAVSPGRLVRIIHDANESGYR